MSDDHASNAETKNRPVRRRKMRRPWWRKYVYLLAVLVVLSLPLWPLACRTSVVPPRDLHDPVDVVLVDHGYTASLVLPGAEPQTMVRYAYGDWNYYALGQREFGDLARALLWPTTGALGRREMPGSVSRAEVTRQMTVNFDRMYEFQVERQRAQQVRTSLDFLVASRIDELVDNPASDLSFVPHPDRYHYFRNSNHLVADWLRDLGCTVRGPAVISRWQVAEE